MKKNFLYSLIVATLLVGCGDNLKEATNNAVDSAKEDAVKEAAGSAVEATKDAVKETAQKAKEATKDAVEAVADKAKRLHMMRKKL